MFFYFYRFSRSFYFECSFFENNKNNLPKINSLLFSFSLGSKSAVSDDNSSTVFISEAAKKKKINLINDILIDWT